MQHILNSLNKIQGLPRMIQEGLALYGTYEVPGVKNNPVIVAWAGETKTTADDWYKADSTPWCGLFMAIVAQRAGRPIPPQHLKALAWAEFGVPAKDAMLGDVLVFTRKGGGHVGLYVGEDAKNYFVLGGNQSDTVNIMPLAKNRAVAIRRPVYKNQPASVKSYWYDRNGTPISTNEA